MNNIINIDGQRYIKIEEYTNLTAEIRREVEHRHQLEDRCKDLTAEVERLKEGRQDLMDELIQRRAAMPNTPPAKPVVWVRESHGGYKFCTDDSGDKLCVLEMCGNMTPNFKAPFDAQFWLEAVAGIVAEVRVWPETCDKCGQAIESEGR